VTVKVATVVAIVVALFVGGPVVWGSLAAASVVLLADSLYRYGKDEASGWEVGLNLLGIVPGAKLPSLVGREVAGGRVVGLSSRVAGSDAPGGGVSRPDPDRQCQ
jgi:hypothetical protein